jgi:hypothetical protein
MELEIWLIDSCSTSTSIHVTNYFQICERCLEAEHQVQADLQRLLRGPSAQHFLNLRDLFRLTSYNSYKDSLLSLQAAKLQAVLSKRMTPEEAKGALDVLQALLAMPEEVQKVLDDISKKETESEEQKHG